MNRHALNTLLLVVILLFVGCGGEKKETPQPVVQSPPAVTKTDATGDVEFRVVLEGTPTTPAPIKMNADARCLKMHNEPAHSQEVITDGKGMLQNVFVYVDQEFNGQTFPTPTAPVVLTQRGCMYAPHVLGIQVNQPLQIVNGDATLHNIHALPKLNTSFNLAQPKQGMKSEKSFSQREIMVRMKCDVHSWMGCYIGVLNHPFFAVTGTNGTAVIRRLPPGEYRIAAWHEKYGVQEQTVSVKGGEVKKVELQFKRG